MNPFDPIDNAKAASRLLAQTRAERVQGEVLDGVRITVKPTTSTTWRLFSTSEGYPYDLRPISEKGRVLGGTYQEAMADAERIAKESGFIFERPSGLLLP